MNSHRSCSLSIKVAAICLNSLLLYLYATCGSFKRQNGCCCSFFCNNRLVKMGKNVWIFHYFSFWISFLLFSPILLPRRLLSTEYHSNYIFSDNWSLTKRLKKWTVTLFLLAFFLSTKVYFPLSFSSSVSFFVNKKKTIKGLLCFTRNNTKINKMFWFIYFRKKQWFLFFYLFI